jgi:hypothetical protein
MFSIPVERIIGWARVFLAIAGIIGGVVDDHPAAPGETI